MSAGSAPLVAVCIPTHHGRAELLGELLERMAPQIPGDGSVEVCISDNGSRDATQDLVSSYRDRLGDRLSYRRAETDLGLAANLFAVIEMARAEYCWLLGSDDAPADDAIALLLALLRSNPGASGAHLGFLRRTMDDLDAPGVDLPPDILPREARPLRLTSVEEYCEQCGVMALPLSCNVVHRKRWLAVAAAEREDAGRTPITPHVFVIGRMVQEDPDWLWSEDRVVLLREAPVFLTEDEYMGARGEDIGQQFAAIAADLDHAWGRLHGRRSALHRTLMETLGRYILHPAAAAVIKLNSKGGAAAQARYLGFARRFWHSREFQRRALPILLTPTRLFRVADGAPGAAPPRGELPARVSGTVPERMISGRGAWIDVLVQNDTEETLSFARPHHAALYARWTDPETGDAIEERMHNTPLYPPVRPGRQRSARQLLTVPPPGTYRLTIDLFDRATGGSLTWEPLTAIVETELPRHIDVAAASGESR